MSVALFNSALIKLALKVYICFVITELHFLWIFISSAYGIVFMVEGLSFFPTIRFRVALPL
jgi:hypothetical protein